MKLELLRELAEVDAGLLTVRDQQESMAPNDIVTHVRLSDIHRISFLRGATFNMQEYEFDQLLFFDLLDRIKQKSWHWEVKSTPGIRDERYKAIIKRRGVHREKWDRNSADDTTPAAALVKAYVRACRGSQ